MNERIRKVARSVTILGLYGLILANSPRQEENLVSSEELIPPPTVPELLGNFIPKFDYWGEIDYSALLTIPQIHEPEPEVATYQGCILEPHRQIIGPVTFYSRAGCVGCRADLKMANQQELRDDRLTIAAVRELPLNSYVLIKNLENEKEIHAQVTDRGGFIEMGFIADITPGVRKNIGGVHKQQMVITPLECGDQKLDLVA